MFLQGAHDREQPLDLGTGQCRGGLVHDQEPGVEAQRLGDLDDLLVGDRQAPNRPVGSQLDAETVDQALHLAVHRPAVDAPERAERVVAHDDVLRDAQIREQRRLLIDDRYAGVAGVMRRVEVDDLTGGQHLAGVPPYDAGEHLDERRLAGAVLADQAADLAGAEHEVAVQQRADGAVGL